MENSSRPISDMWAQLQNKDNIPKGPVFSSCEGELQELMRAVDLMVNSEREKFKTKMNNRQQEYKAKMDNQQQELSEYKAKIDFKQQECLIQKSTLDAKHKEVGQLRSQIEGMEKSRRDMAAEYERQLNMLRTEVCTMKKDYERLQKKYNKHARQVQQDKNRQSSDNEDSVAEMNRLNNKIEEYRTKTREWDQERHSLAKEMEKLQSENKTLGEKCEFIQERSWNPVNKHQAQTYQSQLEKRKGMLDTTEQNLRSQISQLGVQLQRARDTVNSQDTQLGRLKASLDDAISAQLRTTEEKDTIEEEVRKTQAQIQRVEEENVKLREDIDSKEEELHRSQDNINRLNKEVSRLKETINQKDLLMHQFNDSSRQEVEERTNQMMGEVEQLRNSLKKHKRNEKQLLDESGMLQDKLDASRRENSQLNQQIATKVNEVKQKEAVEISHLKKEITRLKDDYSDLRQTQEAELEGMRREVAELTTELHHRNVSMAKISEKAAGLEKQMREQDDRLERKGAELHVSSAQLEAIRLENRHLRRNVMSNSRANVNDSSELAETEKHLREIQGAYTESLTTLEAQNERLQDEIGSLRDQLETVEGATHYKVESALRESEKSLQRAKHDQERLIREARLAGERQVCDIQDKLNDTINEYERRITDMRNDMSLLEDELEIQNRSMRRLGLENEGTNKFVGVDSDLKHKKAANGYLSDYRHSSARHTPESFVEDDLMVDSADLATAQFLAEQNERTKELERKLDLHIEDLERSAQATIDKYLSPR